MWKAEKVNIGADYTAEEVEFLQAVRRFMQQKRTKFPTFVEILNVAKSLGYERRNDASTQERQVVPTI
jgi:hypothetical protein